MNEPAFPGLHPSKECHYADKGMTLRDYFAAKVLNGFLSDPVLISAISRHSSITPDQICSRVYELADAMLKAREQK